MTLRASNVVVIEKGAQRDAVKTLREQYFSAADAVLEKHGLNDTSPEAFRKLLKKNPGKKKAANKKAAS